MDYDLNLEELIDLAAELKKEIDVKQEFEILFRRHENLGYRKTMPDYLNDMIQKENYCLEKIKYLIKR